VDPDPKLFAFYRYDPRSGFKLSLIFNEQLLYIKDVPVLIEIITANLKLNEIC
jgi:hypothetical protein